MNRAAESAIVNSVIDTIAYARRDQQHRFASEGV
jgi:hypothetical protein